MGHEGRGGFLIKKTFNIILMIAAVISIVILVGRAIAFKEEEMIKEDLSPSLFTIDEGEERQGYKEVLDLVINRLNEHSHIIDDQASSIDYFIGQSLTTISTRNKDKSLTISNHKNTKESLEASYPNMEAYTLKNGLKGVIVQDENKEQIDFFQLEAEEDKALIKLSSDLETDLNKAKETFDQFQALEEKSYTIEDLEKQVKISFKDVHVPNLDDINIEAVNMSFTRNDNFNNMTITYKTKKDEFYFHLYYSIYPKEQAGPMRGEKIQGKDIYLDTEYEAQYQWEDDNYQYILTLNDKQNKYTEDDILHIIELSNQVLHP